MTPLHRLARSWPAAAWRDLTAVLAVSGGADSVALLRAMHELGATNADGLGAGRLVVAHFNHRLRGAEADADERFVVELSRSLGLECRIGRGQVQARSNATGDGIEAAAREARYEFLQAMAEQLGARYVVTAHTADDQAETILHRILRGTGLAGLAGIPRVRALGPAVSIIRPLLGCRRAELVGWLDSLAQPYRHDATNNDLDYTRNRLRLDLLPKLAREYNEQIVDALLRLGTLAGEAQNVIDELVEQRATRCVKATDSQHVQIDTRSLAGESRYVVRELLIAVWRQQGWPLQAMGFEQWDVLANVLMGPADGKLTLPGAIEAEKSGPSMTFLAPLTMARS